MIVNLKGVSSENPNEYIKTAGKYTLKITGLLEDGYDKNGDQRIKFTFKTPDGKNHSESFSIGGEYAWRLKRFIEAMKAPEVFDIETLVGRYITAVMIVNPKNPLYVLVNEWEYAIQNDKLEPIKEVASEEDEISAEAEELF